MKKSSAFQWETLGEPNVLVEVSLTEDSRGFHWGNGVTVNGYCVLDYMTSEQLKPILPTILMTMTMLRDEILNELRSLYDREMTAIKNDLS